MQKKKRAGKSIWADPDDAPELTEEYFNKADVYEGEKLVRRGRPRVVNKREQISIRLSPEVIRHFRAQGTRWQSAINDELKKIVSRQKSKR
jgi:uncharacterized protein (DUF4415 family)